MRRLLVAIALIVVAMPAIAQTTVTSTITVIRTGWNDDQFVVVTAAPTQNPARCPSADGYITHRNNPGYQTFLSAALAAFTAHSQVSIIIHATECGPAGRPKLIGINLFQTARTPEPEPAAMNPAGNTAQVSESLTQLASRMERLDQTTAGISRQFSQSTGRSLMTILRGIWSKVVCPDGSRC
jgi:hypothetical protein